MLCGRPRWGAYGKKMSHFSDIGYRIKNEKDFMRFVNTQISNTITYKFKVWRILFVKR
jgi:hypothetical protein